MEWLINRRRMMYNKATTPAYIPFEDSRVWTACCNAWGDHNKTVITDNGNSTVNIVTTFESMRNTALKKSIVIDSQTNVDNTGNTYVAGTTYEPIGITKKQCAAVTSFGSYLRNLGTDLRFTECRYFSVTNVDSGTPFQGDVFERIKFPSTLLRVDHYGNYYYNCEVLDFPESTSYIGHFSGLAIPFCSVLIIRDTTAVHTIAYGTRLKADIEVYVPQELLSAYKEDTSWESRVDNIYSIEGSGYEVFNDWEY